MRVQRAHNREGKFSDLFGPPKSIWWGVGPRRALQFCSSSWFGQAKKAVAEKTAAEEAEKVRSSPTLDGCGLRRTASDTCSCVEWRHLSHSHIALCTTPAVRLRVRTAGRWGRLRVRLHCCSRWQHDSTARSAMWSGGQCAVGTHMCTHGRTSMGTRENKLA
jgi:hypothetical protein